MQTWLFSRFLGRVYEDMVNLKNNNLEILEFQYIDAIYLSDIDYKLLLIHYLFIIINFLSNYCSHKKSRFTFNTYKI